MRCGAVRCGAVWCGAVRCDAVRCDAMQCGAVWCSAVRYGTVRCGAVGHICAILLVNSDGAHQTRLPRPLAGLSLQTPIKRSAANWRCLRRSHKGAGRRRLRCTEISGNLQRRITPYNCRFRPFVYLYELLKLLPIISIKRFAFEFM